MNPPSGASDSVSPRPNLPHEMSSVAAPSNPAPASFPPAPLRMLDEYDLSTRPRRRLLPLVLFVATCFFTYAAGTYHWLPLAFGQQFNDIRGEYWDFAQTWKQLATNWQDGITYMCCVMAVLLAHEMGHFLMTVRHRIPASYPVFLPMPLMVTGTMGAVIGMEGYRANRRQMFDIGIAGPLAGLVLVVPMVWIGVKMATPANPESGELLFGDPLLAKLFIQWLRPDLQGVALAHNPVYMAGWVGMFVTGLNMMPVSQLDGGHVIYALFLQRGRWVARFFLLSAIAFVVFSGQYSWTLMVVIVTLIGVDHPPTADDTMPLGVGRTILGIASLVIPVFCFTPFRLYTGS